MWLLCSQTLSDPTVILSGVRTIYQFHSVTYLRQAIWTDSQLPRFCVELDASNLFYLSKALLTLLKIFCITFNIFCCRIGALIFIIITPVHCNDEDGNS